MTLVVKGPAGKTEGGLPPGWRVVRLGDICDVQLGKMLSPKSKTGLSPQPYLRNANVQWRYCDVSDVAEMDFTDAEKTKFALRPGDLLVCEGGEPGRAAIWNGEVAPCYYQKALHRLRPKGDLVNAALLMHRLRLGALRGEFTGTHGQTTIAHLPADRLRELKVALPPLAEQRRVAAILDEQMAAVERGSAAAAQQLEAARALPSAYLRVLFDSGDAHKWITRKLGDVCDRISDGTHQPPPFTNSGVPFLFVRNIVSGKLNFDVEKHVSVDTYEELVKRCRPQRGDVLYSAVGSFGVAVVIDTDRPFTFQRHIALIKPIPSILVGPYLASYLNSPGGRLQSEATALGGGQRTVTLGSLARFDIPIPPLESQQRIVDQLAERSSVAADLLRCIEQRLLAIETLPHSLLGVAFNGGL